MPPTVFPTGVTIHFPEKAFGCYVLFDGHSDRTYLIDMNGNDVHTWPYAGWPSEMIDPAHANGEKGNIIVQKEANSFDNKTLLELDWDGNVVWEWGEKAPGGSRKPGARSGTPSQWQHACPGLPYECRAGAFHRAGQG